MDPPQQMNPVSSARTRLSPVPNNSSNMRSKEQKRTTFYISTLTLIIMIICAVYVIRADQHVARATVVFDNRTIENARVDWRFSNDIQVSEPSGAVHILPFNSIVSYESNQSMTASFKQAACESKPR
jgi:hypothetical protein